MLTRDDAPPTDLEVVQLAGAHLVIQQFAGEACECLINVARQPLVRFGAGHRFHLTHLAGASWSPDVAEDGRNRKSLQTARSSAWDEVASSHGAGCDQGEEDGVDDLLEGVVVGGGEGGEDFVA
jgi:hypothetical protein